MKIAVIAMGVVLLIVIAVCGLLTMKVLKMEKTLQAYILASESSNANPEMAAQRELAARQIYEEAGSMFFQAFNTIDNALKSEAAAKDRLTQESFEQVFNNCYLAFNQALAMAASIEEKYPGTYYAKLLKEKGLQVAGGYYPLPQLQQNRDLVLQKFVEGRGTAVAFMTRNECKLLDTAIAQFSSEKRPESGYVAKWEDIRPYLQPGSRLETSNGNDVLGNPFQIQPNSAGKTMVKIHENTFKTFRESNFDWGPFAPDRP